MTTLLNAQAATPALPGWIIRLFGAKAAQDQDAPTAAPVTLHVTPTQIAQDCNILPEEVTGGPTWDKDLPFFLQAGFGRN